MAGETKGIATSARVEQALGALPHAWIPARDGLPTLTLTRNELEPALRALHACGFESATFVTAVDWLGRSPRFELVHQLRSLEHVERVRIRTPLAEGEHAPTCTHLWPGAAFMERECYDMFGIEFDGHEGLKRLLMPEGYEHHPLRKDFPHQGIEPDRLYREWDRKRRTQWHPEEAR